ncbi:MAG: archease [Gammaproteobacteria bacterium]|nr:archease [Gammaproteobacteria bacterium]
MRPHVPSWEHFPHQADIGVRGYGHCPAEAFNQAALAMIAVITDPRSIQPHETLTIECRAPDLELLLVDWLNALIYEIATRHVLFCAFDVHINGHHLHATAWGEAIDPMRHQPAVEVKGATFTELHVQAIEPDRWLAQCVVDV